VKYAMAAAFFTCAASRKCVFSRAENDALNAVHSHRSDVIFVLHDRK